MWWKNPTPKSYSLTKRTILFKNSFYFMFRILKAHGLLQNSSFASKFDWTIDGEGIPTTPMASTMVHSSYDLKSLHKKSLNIPCFFKNFFTLKFHFSCDFGGKTVTGALKKASGPQNFSQIFSIRKYVKKGT